METRKIILESLETHPLRQVAKEYNDTAVQAPETESAGDSNLKEGNITELIIEAALWLTLVLICIL